MGKRRTICRAVIGTPKGLRTCGDSSSFIRRKLVYLRHYVANAERKRTTLVWKGPGR